MRKAKHIHRTLSPDEREAVNEARRLTEKDEEEIRRTTLQYKRDYDAGQATLQKVLLLLKEERIRQGLSLADINERTGIEPPNLSRLENDHSANPTVATLTRYAEALGKKLVITLAE